MQPIPVSEAIRALGFPNTSELWGEFLRLGHLTALKCSRDGVFYVGNWWRGPLLYALVAHHKPCTILEFGTGRGYGALAMAKAAVDAGLDTTVWTIDRVPPTTAQPWPIDEGDGPRLATLSVREVWERHIPEEVRARVKPLIGDSYDAMRQWSQERREGVDFFFIDGGHDYWTVKHDFLASLQVANRGAVFVFDDYGNRPCYGVKKLLIEALHCGLPAIALNDGGHPEIIGQAGEFFAHPVQIPTLIGKIIKNYEYYRNSINLPSLNDIGQRYFEFMQMIYDKVQRKQYVPKRLHIGGLLKIKFLITWCRICEKWNIVKTKVLGK